MAEQDPLLQALGEVVRERRLELGLNQLDLPEGIDHNAIGRLERATVNTTVGQLAKVAAALNTTPSELLRAAEKRI